MDQDEMRTRLQKHAEAASRYASYAEYPSGPRTGPHHTAAEWIALAQGHAAAVAALSTALSQPRVGTIPADSVSVR